MDKKPILFSLITLYSNSNSESFRSGECRCCRRDTTLGRCRVDILKEQLKPKLSTSRCRRRRSRCRRRHRYRCRHRRRRTQHQLPLLLNYCSRRRRRCILPLNVTVVVVVVVVLDAVYAILNLFVKRKRTVTRR